MELRVDIDYKRLAQAAERSQETTVQEIRRGLLESCRLVQSEARAKHRFRSRNGNLEKAVVYDVDAERAEGVISIDDVLAPYGVFVHEGTRPHEIHPKHKKALRWPYGQEFHFAKVVHHPGTQPDQFLYEAADRSREEINAIFSRHVDEAFRRAGLA